MKSQMTIYLNETDMHGELPLYEFIVRRLLHLNVIGATVVRGMMGFGQHGRVHRQRLFGVTDDRPILILAVDDTEHLRSIIPEIRKLIPGGLVTLQPVETE